ncbi:hypothetical protein LJC31_05850 [Synergistaceae bacterium OttesenSCG-928-I11]|nr:hypothetical protein [Synergistaceae bacterium OttesenSCG-928-I11]
MTTSKTSKFARVCMLGLIGCLMALGAMGTASAGDTMPGERAAMEEFNRIPSKQIVWSSEELREGAEYAARLDSSDPFPSDLKPYDSVSWTSEEMREGAKKAEAANREK